VEKAVVEISNRNNAEYAVPEWSVLEDDVVNEFGHGSIQHVITVLYRYNTVRNDTSIDPCILRNTKRETHTDST
jgi:hypothetical protein